MMISILIFLASVCVVYKIFNLIRGSRPSSLYERWNAHIKKHDPSFQSLSANSWYISGDSVGIIGRKMTVFRLANNDLVLHSPMALSEDLMDQLESFGTVKYIIIPPLHTMDAEVYQSRYPFASFICTSGAERKFKRTLKVTFDIVITQSSFSVSSELSAVSPVYTPREMVWMFKDPSDETSVAVVTDIVFNIPLEQAKGFGGWMQKKMGSVGFFGVSRIGRFFLGKNLKYYVKMFETMAVSPPDFFIMSHGNILRNKEQVKECLEKEVARLSRLL
ncbi:hypothetical protein GEMRC1_012015 [Eukaryota sp. GEM-RC1]